MKDERRDILGRIYLIYMLLLVIAIVIVFRVIKIQFVEGDKWRSRAENLTLRYENVDAIRGNIISADSNLLATSVPIFDVRMDMHRKVVPDSTFRENLDSLALCLSKLFPQKSKDEFKKYLKNGRKKKKRDLLIAKNINYSQLKKLRTFPILRKGRYKGGVIIEEKDFRLMPYKMMASRTIGYRKEHDNIYVGIEGAFHKELAGVSGKRLMRKIANGVWRQVENANEMDPENGKDIITTIDTRIQDVAESALMKCLDSNEADHGCAILMEVATGEIRAIANLKRHADGSYGEDINYAIWESGEPGSTFKLASTIAVLEEGKLDTNAIVPTGIAMMANRKMEDSHEEGYGNITLAKAFEVSSNVGISKAVVKSFSENPQKFVDHLHEMGLNKPLGIELKGEGKPYVKNTDSKTWSATSLPWMSIGYELKITPLQTLALYNAVANNGKLMKPHVVKEIRLTGKLIQKFDPVVLKSSICSESTVNKVKTLLENVVSGKNGTAKSLRKSVYKIAGKTGTAQLNYYNKDEALNYKASFVGYFPADNPKYSCIVVVNGPKKNKIYGGEVAAPVFKEIADKVYATQLGISAKENPDSIKVRPPFVRAAYQPDLLTILRFVGQPIETEDISSLWVSANKMDSIPKYSTYAITRGAVPNVVGMGVRDAIYLLEKAGMNATALGRGRVVNQSVPPGSILIKGQKIILKLAPPKNCGLSNDFSFSVSDTTKAPNSETVVITDSTSKPEKKKPEDQKKSEKNKKEALKPKESEKKKTDTSKKLTEKKKEEKIKKKKEAEKPKDKKKETSKGTKKAEKDKKTNKSDKNKSR